MANTTAAEHPAAPEFTDETHAGTEAVGAEHGPDPAVFGLDATMWVALAMLAVIALLVWKKVPAAIGRSLDQKIEGIRNQLAEAETLRKEAEAIKAEYEAKSAAASSEVAAMLERARNEADAILIKAREDAEALVERRSRMAEAKIASEERAAVEQLRATAADAASQAAARLIAERLDDSADEALITEAISGLAKR